MRAQVALTWVLLNAIFFGLCCYMYLLWTKNLLVAKNPPKIPEIRSRDRSNYYHRNSNHFRNRTEITEAPMEKREITFVKNSKPRFPSPQNDDFKMDTSKYACLENDTGDECESKTAMYKEKLLGELHRVLLEEGNVLRVKNGNRYNVRYSGGKTSGGLERSGRELLCDLKKVPVSTIKRTDPPFDSGVLREYLPKKELFEKKRFSSCAVIASAGSLKDSNLGKIIDDHNLVLRFNHAPTTGFETDVGSKTTFRIVNSQVVTKSEFNFLTTEIYQNNTLLAWDPSNYTASLADWYACPEFDLFPNYIEYRKRKKRSRFFLLNPRSLWGLWDFLQRNSAHQLRRNPPSSGFLGLAVLLPFCDYVDMFEYVPSVRVTRRCHYYDAEDNPACTFGVWHPLAAEKLATYSMNVASDKVVFQTGFARIPGYRTLNC